MLTFQWLGRFWLRIRIRWIRGMGHFKLFSSHLLLENIFKVGNAKKGIKTLLCSIANASSAAFIASKSQSSKGFSDSSAS